MSKRNYLCIQRSQPRPAGFGKREAPSPAQMDQMYAQFNAWKEKFQDNIVDMGGKLGGGKIVTADGVSDRPFVEAKEVVGWLHDRLRRDHGGSGPGGSREPGGHARIEC